MKLVLWHLEVWKSGSLAVGQCGSVEVQGPVRGRLGTPYPYISEHIYPLSLRAERQLSL